MIQRIKAEIRANYDPIRFSALETEARRNSSAPVLGILPGLGVPASEFEPILHAAERWGWGAVAIDYPGHGESEPRRPPATLADLATLALAVFSKIDPARLVVLGHSLGGVIALDAFARSAQVRAFVSVEGNLTGEDCGFVSRRCAEITFETFRQSQLTPLIERFARSDLLGDRAYAWCLNAVDLEQFHALCAPIVAASDSGRLLSQFNALDMARLYIHGQHTGRPQHVTDFCGDIEVVEIPRAGHLAFLDNPDAFLAALRAFVGRVLPEGIA